MWESSHHVNIIFSELIENVDQMKLKKMKNKVTLEVSLDLKIYFNYTVYSHRMNPLPILISVVANTDREIHLDF